MIFGNDNDPEEINFISISDLMAALMLLFLLISVSFMVNVNDKNSEIIELYDRLQILNIEADNTKKSVQNSLEDLGEIYRRYQQFEIVLGNLSISILSKDHHFGSGDSEVSPEFSYFLQKFCVDLYDVVLTSKSSIESIVFEGHTDRTWTIGSSDQESYFGNMKLSQNRAYSVMRSCLSALTEKSEYIWFRSKLSAAGYSFSKSTTLRIYQARRVEFRINLNSSEKIRSIVQESIK